MTSTPPPLRIVTDPSRNPGALHGSKLEDATVDELVSQAVAGDRAAFDELVRRTHRDAYGLALRLTADEEDARDVVQEAYLRAYRHLDRFRGDAQFGTWLYRIVANCASTAMGKRRRHRHEPLSDEVERTTNDDPAGVRDPGMLAEAAELRERLDAAVRELPPRLRVVVVLRDVYDLPHDAIAEELGI
ncbi:MAG: sigma-70 family RNA polymerase sigma factor, partial [Acidimicrobiales bacterium]